MSIFIITFAVFALAVTGLAAGVLMGRKPLKGSCGGLSSIPGLEESKCSCNAPCEAKQVYLDALEQQRTES